MTRQSLKSFRSFEAIKRDVGTQAGRAPFSALWGGVRVTLFYCGGWNMMSAELCAQFPSATFNRVDAEASRA